MGFSNYGKKEVSEKTKRLERIDELLSRLNSYWVAPLNTDVNTGSKGYELIFRILKTISLEMSESLKEKDLKDDREFNEKIDKLIKEQPIFSRGKPKNGFIKTIYSPVAWANLEKELFSYDRTIRIWVTKYLKDVLYGEGLSNEEIVIVDGDD